MSWGERSCVHKGKCPIPEERSIGTCDVKCREYRWDGSTKPDSKKDNTSDIPYGWVRCVFCLGFGCRLCSGVGLVRK